MFGWSVCIHSLPFGSSGLQSSTVAGSDAGTIGQALKPSTIEEGRVGPLVWFPQDVYFNLSGSKFNKLSSVLFVVSNLIIWFNLLIAYLQIFWDAEATNLSVVISSGRAIKDELSSWNINFCQNLSSSVHTPQEKNWAMKTSKRSMNCGPRPK